MQKIITISLNKDEDINEAMQEVTKMIRDGYTSGYQPNFSINEEN